MQSEPSQYAQRADALQRRRTTQHSSNAGEPTRSRVLPSPCLKQTIAACESWPSPRPLADSPGWPRLTTMWSYPISSAFQTSWKPADSRFSLTRMTSCRNARAARHSRRPAVSCARAGEVGEPPGDSLAGEPCPVTFAPIASRKPATPMQSVSKSPSNWASHSTEAMLAVKRVDVARPRFGPANRAHSRCSAWKRAVELKQCFFPAPGRL